MIIKNKELTLNKEFIHRKELSFGILTVVEIPVGDDLQLLVYGGDEPHLGCSVLAEPRPSLKNDGTISATASVLNAPGHKDDVICRYLAEKYASARNTRVVCSGGFHVDNITAEQIQEVVEACKELV